MDTEFITYNTYNTVITYDLFTPFHKQRPKWNQILDPEYYKKRREYKKMYDKTVLEWSKELVKRKEEMMYETLTKITTKSGSEVHAASSETKETL